MFIFSEKVGIQLRKDMKCFWKNIDFGYKKG